MVVHELILCGWWRHIQRLYRCLHRLGGRWKLCEIYNTWQICEMMQQSPFRSSSPMASPVLTIPVQQVSVLE